MEQENFVTNEEKGFTFADFWYVIRKFWLLILLVTVGTTAIGAIYTFGFAKPDYKSTANVIVAVEAQSQGGTETVDYTNSLRVVNTIGDLVDDEVVLEPVATEYKVEISTLRSGLKTSVSSTSFMITVSYIDEDKDKAQKYCDAIVESLIEVSENNPAVQKLKVTVSKTNPASNAVYNSPNKTLYMAISFAAGAVAGVVTAFVVEAVANKFSSKSDVEDNFPDIAVIGKFYENKALDKRNKKCHRRRAGKLVGNTVRELEPYNSLLSNIYYSNPEKPYKAVLITSNETQDLKTTTIANLAYCAVVNGKKVILIDFDVRKPTLHRTFRVEMEKGLIDYIGGTCKEEDIIKHTESGVDMITPGLNVVNPAILTQSEKAASLIKSLKEKYDYVFVDTPPVSVCNDSLVLSKVVDGVVFNIALTQTKKVAARESIQALKQYGANIIGINLTKYPLHAKNENYYSRYYNEYYNKTEQVVAGQSSITTPEAK